jgi:hypothetical protein
MQSVTVRAAPVARPAVGARVAARSARSGLRTVRLYSSPNPGQVEQAIKEAEEACEGGPSGEW